ncbi:MAG: DUF484 family protein, partial [Stellaceae bacterium]
MSSADRPQDKKADSAAAPARAVGEGDVHQYLKAHPDFLVHNPEFLSVLTPPQLQRGDQVVDMQSFMLQRQRQELEKLQRQHGELIGTSRANLASQARVHGAALALFSARSFEQLIQTVTTDLAVMLDADVATIGVESVEPMKPTLRNQGIQILKPGMVEELFGPDRDVLLFDEVEGDPVLFGDGAGLVRSAALLRLRVSLKSPAGLLAIGTRAPGKFHAAQGTELLNFLGR